jgi:phosphoribosylformylglycinamidine cyclo-ligase
LAPSVIYTPAVRAAIVATSRDGNPGVHAVAHITGGGFAGNVPRALPAGLRAVIDRYAWEVPPIFSEIRRLGRVADDEMARVFNLGLGMVLLVAEDRAGHALSALADAGVEAAVVGHVEAGERGVSFVGAPFWSEDVPGEGRVDDG